MSAFVSRFRDIIPLLLLNTGEAMSKVLCPVLGSPVEESHGYAGGNPVKSNKEDEGTGASVHSGSGQKAQG